MPMITPEQPTRNLSLNASMNRWTDLPDVLYQQKGESLYQLGAGKLNLLQPGLSRLPVDLSLTQEGSMHLVFAQR